MGRLTETRVTLVAPVSMQSGLVPVTVPRGPWEDAQTPPDHRPETRPRRAMPTQPPRPARPSFAERLRWLQQALAEERETEGECP